MANIQDLDNLMSDLDSVRRSTGGMGATRVYPQGSYVTQTFSKTENNVMTMTSDRASPLQDRRMNREVDPERSASPLITRPKSPGPSRKVQPVGTSPRTPGLSGATQELDDLMASLNDFKVTPSSQTGFSEKYLSSVSKRTTDNYQSTSSSRDQKSVSPINNENWNARQTTGSPSQNGYNANGKDTLDRNGATSAASNLSDNYCAGCEKAVAGQVVTALGKTWHLDCFKCRHCSTALRTQPFFEKNGQAYCEEDYYKLFAMKCARCSQAIKDTCFTALDNTWHPDCFRCARCSGAFGESSFHERDGKPFCEECYLKSFAPQCAGCQNPIAGTYLNALDTQWHKECFVCTDCRQPFENGSFFDLEGRPYCEQHYHANRGSVCGTCQKPIQGRCITAMGKKFHPDHFVCAYCVRPLNKGTFKEHANKPWCHNCFERLYGEKKDGAGHADL